MRTPPQDIPLGGGTARIFSDGEPAYRPRFVWKPNPGEPQELHPEPIGALPLDARAGPALYERLRAAKAVSVRPNPRTNPAADMPLSRRALRPAFRAAPSPPAALGMFGAGIARAPGVAVTLGYGAISFAVPLTFLSKHSAGVGRSSIDDTLAALWPDFEAAMSLLGVPWSTIDARTGCWNLSKDPSAELFWDRAWGGAYHVHGYALQMIRVFHAFIVDESSGHPCGAGTEFGDFLVGLITEGTAKRSDHTNAGSAYRGKDVEFFRIHFPSLDGRFYNTYSLAGIEGHEQRCCESAFYNDSDRTLASNTCGARYDDWDPVVDTITSRLPGTTLIYGITPKVTGNSFYQPGGEETRNGAPATNCPGGANAPGTYDRIRMQPVMLDFYGYMSDYLMWLARIALDYYLETGSTPHFDAAYAIARHALNQILYHAGHIVHESGHVFCGTDHCATNHCFMNHARFRFVCRVRTVFGLYHDNVDFTPDNDGCFTLSNLTCSTNHEGPSVTFCSDSTNWTSSSTSADVTCGSSQKMVCNITSSTAPFELGRAYADEVFCMTKCTASDQTGWNNFNCGSVHQSSVRYENGYYWKTCSIV